MRFSGGLTLVYQAAPNSSSESDKLIFNPYRDTRKIGQRENKQGEYNLYDKKKISGDLKSFMKNVYVLVDGLSAQILRCVSRRSGKCQLHNGLLATGPLSLLTFDKGPMLLLREKNTSYKCQA